MGSRSPMDPDNLDAAERGRQALELRRDGKTWPQIAEELGYADRASAYNAAKRLLDRTEFESVEEYRAIEADRLDEAHRIQFGALEVLVSMGKFEAVPPAVSALAKISDRRSKLLGLDAPTRVNVTGTEDFAATAVQLMAEILDAEAEAEARPEGDQGDDTDGWVR
ncbi:hypothetical protein EV641_109207 [Rhodococcus sp. SMB37]|uniref:hypothetical protein n=1 Tax=Rhodococcus sp. SMB37 TaxID=2512213 RepID=UPI0010E2F08B|nr:hypothetical protein [Rhodococcus sp. SMB37]TCN51816.1 hypothetical protein EV641_109207 [Rhodococcus sp. SMB37]